MLLAVVLSPVLVGLPAVLATPAQAPARVSQASPLAFIPAAIEKAYEYGHQIAQWTLGKNEADSAPISRFSTHGPPGYCWPQRPHRPHERVVVNKTIYEVLSGESRFSKLFKLVNLNNATIDLLNDTSSDITFFAPLDSAFPTPRHGRQHLNMFSGDPVDAFQDLEDPAEFSLVHMLDEVDSMTALDEDEDKQERRRKIIKYIVGAVISYHVIPQPFDVLALAKNTTHGTNLTLPDGSLDGKPLRVRVGRAPFSPALAINIFSRVEGPEIVTSNGIIHAISRPLLPPPAIFTGQFNLPSVFSIATSALQRVGLTEEIDFTHRPSHIDGVKSGSVGAGTVTFFAPSNRAFQRLPARLRLFLFSPFGHRALKKLLQYHIIPLHAVHSDYIHNATNSVSMQEMAGNFADIPERNILAGQYENLVVHGRGPMEPVPAIEIKMSSPPMPAGPPMPARALARSKPQPQIVDILDEPRRVEIPRHRPAPPNVEYNVTVVVPTLLENHTHTIVVTKFAESKAIPGFPRPPASSAERTRVTVSGGRVALADVPARNGAVHVVDQLLNPLRRHKHHEHEYAEEMACQRDERHEWNDWEDWLPKWAEEE